MVRKRKTDNCACMLTYSFYENDTRVRKYAESLVEKGWHVDVFALKQAGQKASDMIKGVTLFRIQRREKNEKRKLSFVIRMVLFLILSSFHVTMRSFKKRYAVVHVHSVPDFEVFAAFWAKILGACVILDIHDPVPDFFAVKFGNRSIFISILKYIEKISSRYADHVITVTDYWREVIRDRSRLPDDKISVILNLPNISLFNPDTFPPKTVQNSHFTLIYPGTINRHCGLHIAIQAARLVSQEISSFRFQIYGGGTEYDAIVKMVADLKLEDIVIFNKPVRSETVPALLHDADAGIALLSGGNNYAQQALNVKLFEFLAMGLPSIATQTKSTKYYLNEEVVMFSKMDDPEDIARCIKELHDNPEKRKSLSENGRAYVQKNNSLSEMTRYSGIIDGLLHRREKA